jgi:putative transposase
MPSKMLKTPVLPDKYYHIFNRANNNELVFKDHEDYQFFMQNLGELLAENIDIFAFCLMPNHFHLFIQPKYNAKTEGEGSISSSTRRFFQVYSQYFNKKYSRKGSLFYKSFRRIEIKDEIYLRYILFYIHYNPQKSQIVSDYSLYQYSSYRFFITNSATKLRKDIVLQWFANSLDEFEKFHLECLERIHGILAPEEQTGSKGAGVPLGWSPSGLEFHFVLPLLKNQFQ